MKLLPIEEIFTMDCGAPMPILLSANGALIVAFHGDADGACVVLRFDGVWDYRFGYPSNETLFAHPYYKLGMHSYSFYRLEGSEWLLNIERMQSEHSRYRPGSTSHLTHYIITFHDDMLECVAGGFELLDEQDKFYNQALALLEIAGKR